MRIKLHYLFSHFLENLGNVSDEQGEVQFTQISSVASLNFYKTDPHLHIFRCK